MTQLGEGVAIGLVLTTDWECPFHEDEHDCSPRVANDLLGNATTLGQNLHSGNSTGSTVLRRETKPDSDYCKPVQEKDPDTHFTETQREVNLVKGNPAYTYPVVYSAHHLIPSNESLDRSVKLRRYMERSKNKVCCDLGYNVNGSENGVWLPALHAVNSKGLKLWGSASDELPADEADTGGKVVKRTELEDGTTQWDYAPLAGPRPADGADAWDAKNLKWRYVLAAMNLGLMTPRQFHDRHVKYSDAVEDHLNNLAAVLEKLSGTAELESTCPKCAKNAKTPRKPPIGLLGALNTASSTYRSYVVGSVSNDVYFTSSWCGPRPAMGSPAPKVKNNKRKATDQVTPEPTVTRSGRVITNNKSSKGNGY